MELSKKASVIKPSATLSLTAKANQLKAEGMDVVGFSAGEPDFDTPQHIKQAAIDAINAGFTKYTPASGTVELRKAIAEKYKGNGLNYDYSQVVVSNGGKHALLNIFLAILNDGDEVIIPSPHWLSYPEIVRLAGGTPVIVKSQKENQYKITRDELKNAYSPKTKAIIINSPSNPTGLIYSKDELTAIADFAIENDLLVVSDEIYEQLIYGNNRHLSIASLGPDILNRTIIVDGLSKTYAMTGWRIGYSVSNPEIAKLIGNIQSHSASNPNSIAQKAAYAALKGPQDCVNEMRQAFEKRRDYLCGRIEAVPGISTILPEGAFYVFADISPLLGQSVEGTVLNDAVDFSDILLDKENCVVVPCNDFGYNTHIRLSYATSMENIEDGMNRIERFIRQYFS